MIKYPENNRPKQEYEYKEFIRPQVGDIVLIEGSWTKGRSYFYLVNFTEPFNEWISAIRIHPTNYRYAKTKELEISGEYLRANKCSMPDGFANIFTGITSLHIGGIKEIVSHIPRSKYMDIVGCMISMMMGNYFIDKSKSLILKDFTIDIKMPIDLNTILRSAVGLKIELGMKEDKAHSEALVAPSQEVNTTVVIKEPAIPVERDKGRVCFAGACVENETVQERFNRVLKEFQETYKTDKIPLLPLHKILEGAEGIRTNCRTYIFSKAEVEAMLEKSCTTIINSTYERIDGKYECPSNGAGLKNAAKDILPYLK